MDNRSAVPPYEANPNSMPQHAPMHTADSYGSAPGQPVVQHDIYQGQTPISPMQTGTTNTYPNAPMGSPPLDTPQYHQQPQQISPQPMGSPPPLEHPKGDFYGSQQQVPMQHVQTNQMQPVQMQQSQYHTSTPIANLQRTAAPVDCPICRHRAVTRVEHHSGNTTHAWALVICCFLCVGCIPYLIDSLKDVEHKCGNCGVALATWHQSGHNEVHAHA